MKIGVIGAGTYGVVHLEALLQRQQLQGDISLVGFAEPNQQRRSEVSTKYAVQGYPDVETLLQEATPHAVTVVTPDHLHHAIVTLCLEKGCHVLVEKPFATDLQQAREMAANAKRLGKLVQVDFHKRFDPYHLDLKHRVHSGELGDIQYGYCWMEDVLRVGTDMLGQTHWGGAGSPAWFLSTHMIDLTYWVMGFPKAVEVFATGFKGKLSSMGINIYDSIKAEVCYQNGAVITYDSSVILPNSHESLNRQGVKLVGTEGFMVVDSQYRGARGCSTAKGMETPNLGMAYYVPDKSGGTVKRGYLNESIIDFIDNVQMIENGRHVEEIQGYCASPDQGIETTKIGVAIHKSIETRQRYNVQDM